MSDEAYFKGWAKADSNRQADVPVINCFPYGIWDDQTNSLDVMGDTRPWSISILFHLAWLVGIFIPPILILITLTDRLGLPYSASLALFVFGIALRMRGPLAAIGKLADHTNRHVLKLKRIYITEKGLKLFSRNTQLLEKDQDESTFFVPFDALKSIDLANPEEKEFTKLKLRFEGEDGSPFDIPLIAIHTQENWATFSEAVKKFAPDVEIDPGIVKALTLSSTNYSFTELWLDSLASAPKGDHLVPLLTGKVIGNGRFVINSKLASGGQGNAYAGQDLQTQRQVVIKEYLLPVYQSNQVRTNAISQIESESKMLRRVHHPHIVEFIDLFEEDSRAFLVLNRISGSNLKAFVEKNGPAPPHVARQLTMQMCDILGYLHALNPPIIHRDFTPENLIIDDHLQLTLIDFTISEPAEDASDLPPAGKPAYMPPEQYQGRTYPASDIYSLGGTLYFLLTGQQPEALRQLKLPLGLDESLSMVVSKCTAQDIEKRFGSASEISAAIAGR